MRPVDVAVVLLFTFSSVSWGSNKTRAPLFEEIDLDKSGDLCRDEISENSVLEKHFAILDANSDALLSKEEYSVFVAIVELDDQVSLEGSDK